jgi:hypothetical protein
MLPLLYVLLATARSSLKAQRELALENLIKDPTEVGQKPKMSRNTSNDLADKRGFLC